MLATLMCGTAMGADSHNTRQRKLSPDF